MGDACNFAHSSEEIRHAPSLVATQLCFQFSAKGMCSKGEACTFAHSKEELQPMPLEAIVAPKRPAKAPKEPKNPKKSQPKIKVHSPALDPLSQLQLLQMKICQLAELQQSVPVPAVPFVPLVPFRPPPGLEAPMDYLPNGRVDKYDKFECGSMVSTSFSCTPRGTTDSDSEPSSPLSPKSEAIWF